MSLWCQIALTDLRTGFWPFWILIPHCEHGERNTYLIELLWLAMSRMLGLKHLKQLVLSSVQFSCSVLSDSLQHGLHGLQHARLPCSSPTPEPTQTHVHHVSDAIQPSHPLSSPSPPTVNLSQHQGLFQWVSSSHQVAKVLEFQLQHQSFQWIFRTDFL